MTSEVSALSNGFRITTDHMPGLRTATVAVHVGVGARYENAKQNGIAHFLEHMAFKGTHRRTAFEIAETIEDVGGYLNAYTSRESTVYLAGVLAEDVPLAVELLADILRHSVFSPDEIEVERGVILNEIGEYEDLPTDVVFDGLQRTAYPNQQYGRPVIGTAKTVSAFGRSDFQSFTDRHYGPERMILSAAGAVHHDAVSKLAEKHFGDASKQLKVRKRRPRFVGGEWRRAKDIEQAQFAIAFPGPQLLDESVSTAMIYGVLLGGGSSSRLFREAREKRGLCYSVSAQAAPCPDSGLFILHANTGRAELKSLMEICAEEIRKSADGLTEKEVKRAQTQIRVAIMTGYESPAHRMERMVNMLAIKDEVESIDATIARYDDVTLEMVQDYAHQLASSTDAAMALYGPLASSNALSLDNFLGRMQP